MKITKELAVNFKKSYSCKMGGTQTVCFPKGEKFFFNDEHLYSGRGSKYNKSINYSVLGDVTVTKQELKDFDLKLKARKSNLAKERKQVELAKQTGVYVIDSNGYLELSMQERYSKVFDVKRLANTLKIKISQVKLLNSIGKTYVFAESENGTFYKLYHADLLCNSLSIHVSEISKVEMQEFIITWGTNETNHFVC